MYQKKEKNFPRKMSPRLSQLNVAIAHRSYFRQNNLWILKLVTYTKIEYHYSTLGANWQLFRWEWIAKCSYSILSTQNIKFYWFVMKIKTFLLPIWWYNRGLFPLGNKYFGVFVLNGLKPCHKSHVRQFLQNGVGSGYLVRQWVTGSIWQLRGFTWRCGRGQSVLIERVVTLGSKVTQKSSTLSSITKEFQKIVPICLYMVCTHWSSHVRRSYRKLGVFAVQKTRKLGMCCIKCNTFERLGEAIMTSTMIPLYTHIKLRGYAFRCAKYGDILRTSCIPMRRVCVPNNGSLLMS